MFPEELTSRKQWLPWGFRDEEQTQKIPLYLDGSFARTNKPEKFYQYDEIKHCERVAFVFQDSDPYVGFDLDNCLDEKGQLRSWAMPIAMKLSTAGYGEISPSGTGIKFILRGRKPSTRCKVSFGDSKQQLEVYEFNRFWAMTGCIYASCNQIRPAEECQPVIDWIFQEYLEWNPNPNPEPEPEPVTAPPPVQMVDYGQWDPDVVEWVETKEGEGNLSGFDPQSVIQDLEAWSHMPLETRIQSYLDKCPVPAEGNRNTAIFSVMGHCISFVDESGKGLPFDTVQAMVRAWYSEASDPISDKEFETVTRSAARNGTPREKKAPNQMDVSDIPAFNQPEIPSPPPAAEMTPQGNLIVKPSVPITIEDDEDDEDDIPVTKGASAPPQFPAIAQRPPGIIEQIIEYNLKYARYPQPELALAGAIALMSVITGRKLEDPFGTRTNLYVLSMAPSGAGKEHARKVNKKLLELSGGEELYGPERVGSHAGIINFVAHHGSILFQLDEIGRLFQTLKNPGKSPHLYNIASVLMQLYSSSDTKWISDAYADIDKTKSINQPHAVIYGTSCPEDFWESLTSGNVKDGLVGRLLPFEAGRVMPVQSLPKKALPNQNLIDDIKFWIDYDKSPQQGQNLFNMFPNVIQASYTPAAEGRLQKHINEIAKKMRHEDEQIAALWARAGEKTSKLALIFAASRCVQTTAITVDLQDVDRAIALSNYLTRSIIYRIELHVAETIFEENCKKMLRVINDFYKKNKRAIKLSELTVRVRWCNSKEKMQFISELKATKQIIETEIKSKTKTAAAYEPN